ncbi:MAG: glycosyltransferase, partial [Deltaproteobacteria bacterium]|nr:glycosyltransferase [Deltaproteobacteria bacterium]
RTLSPGEPLRIASVCRLTEKKGIDVGLRALSRAAKRGVRFEYHLVGDGPGRAELERLRDELGLAGVTTLYGARTREEIRTLLARCHLFLAPSVTAADGDEEGTPVAIMEAMASGLPVLSTVHSGIPEMIEDGVSGALVPERDDAALAESIVRLASAPSEWPALARRARQAIEERYDAERLNDSLSTLLTELGHQRRRPGAAPSGRAARGDFA